MSKYLIEVRINEKYSSEDIGVIIKDVLEEVGATGVEVKVRKEGAYEQR